LFSTFPGGSPGFGLLILRTALGISTLFRGALYLSETGDSASLNRIIAFLTVVSAIFLLVGFLTPVSGAIVFMGSVLSAALGQSVSITVEIYTIAMTAAIVFLGPGAFSLDARLFGRREIFIPKMPSAGDD